MAKPVVLKDHKFTKAKPQGYQNIMKFFQNYVVEVKFLRKNYPTGKDKKPGRMRKNRRMLCTSNWRLIASPLTRRIFRWSRPKGPRRGYPWYQKRNILITWDLLNQDWRMVHLRDWKVIGAIPVNTLLSKAKFIVFYNNELKKMTPIKDPSGNKRNNFADKQ